MGRINKDLIGVTDKIKPLTLIISSALWDKFKILSSSKDITLNDYIIKLIEKEVSLKEDAIKMLQE
jgi:hypothetical protein